MEALDAARKRLAAADHILTQSYPLLQDPKLLLAVLSNLHSAIDAMIEALLEHEAREKRIPLVPTTPDARRSLFRQVLRLPSDLQRLVSDVHEALRQHEASPVEFARKEAFVICDDQYSITALKPEALRRHVTRAKALLKLVEEQVNPHDRIAARRA